MTSYRRNFVPGGSFFFAVNLADRRTRLLTEQINLLRAAVRHVRTNHPFRIDAWVVLPEHMHAIWTLPPDDLDYSNRWRIIKGEFARKIPRTEEITGSRRAKGERGIWQRRFWEHTLRDEEDFARHFDYVHYNPVKHGWVERVRDWPYSSFHRCVAAGIYAADWGGDFRCDFVVPGDD